MSHKQDKDHDKSATVHVDRVDDQASANALAAARAGLKWGITPKEPRDKNAVPGPDHPVHKIPVEKQEKMRKKGINPVLFAEMNQNNTGQRGFWAKLSGTAMGGGWIK